MTREYSRIFFEVILVSKQPSKVIFWPSKANFLTSKLIFECFKSIFWTSMPPMHQNYSILLDLNAFNASELFHILVLNASNASEQFHIIGPQCLQCIRAIDGDDGGGGDGGGGGFPRTLESGRSPGPTCPGTKYPVRGIPHFDEI